MTKDFIPYTQSLQLKELGFDEPCFGYYKDMKGEKVLLYDTMDFDGECNTPLYQQAFRWFREKYSLLSEIGLRDREDLSTWKCEITVIGKYDMKHNSTSYNTYEEAELACLEKLIEIVKNK